ncbi:MAG: Ig-like domain-containing protein, partial [Thermoanaerobaculia bacterium]
PENTTNATYGSITDPVDFGSGGGGKPGGTVNSTPDTGGNGGGALKLTAAPAEGLGRFVLAGIIRADGGACSDKWGCGSGGSILINANAVITGAKSRITANGGSDSGQGGSAGGGGGRLSFRVRDRLDVIDFGQIQVRGGYNGVTGGGNSVTDVDGGSGTIFLKRPDSVNGELILTSWDERFPSSVHRTRGTPLSGNLTFDKITVRQRALARFDNAYTIPDPSALVIETNGTVITPEQVPSITLVSFNPASGSTVIAGTSIVGTYSAASPARVTRIRGVLSANPTQAFSGFTSLPTTVAQTTFSVPIAENATVGAATLKLVITDLAGRTAETSIANYTVVANGAPVISRFDTTPANEMYAGHTIDIDAAATDDVKVKELTLTNSIGSLTSDTAIVTGNQTARRFHVAIANTVAPGTVVTLTLKATDDHASTPDTTQQKTVTILSDTIAPSLTINAPAEGTVLQEGAGNKFTIQVTATDAEVAVKRVIATLDGVPYTLDAGANNTFSKQINVPNVDGTEDVPKSISIAAEDFQNNVNTQILNVVVRPLIDPNAPTLYWVCASPNALYPANYDVKLRVFAKGATTTNAIQNVTFTIDNNAPVTATAAGNDFYELTFTIPGGTPAGKVYNVIVRA